MFKEIPTYFLNLVTLFSIFGVIYSRTDKDVYIHCTQTARNRLDSTPRTIVPEVTNASAGWRQVSGTSAMNLGLCPDQRFLKISWLYNQTQENVIKLCYRMDSIQNETIMNTTCFRLHIFESPHQSALDCWFPMDFIDRRPIITAWAYPSASTSQGDISGILDTSLLDPENTCKDMCEVVAMNIGSQISCRNKASITYNTSTVVKRLSFDIIDKTSCENKILHISRQTDSRLEYQLNCGFNGLGHVKVLYITHGRYCLKYQPVTVRCPNGSSTPVPLTSEPDSIHSFGTFILFGCVCIVVISLAFFGMIFVVQRLMDLRARYFKAHRDSMTDSRNVSISGEENIPLHMDKLELTECVPQETAVNTNIAALPRKPSRRKLSSTSLNNVQEMAQEKHGFMTSKFSTTRMRKSVTMALLEDTDPFYKKRIIFLPIPFDHYTNEVTNLLKTIFSNEAGIMSLCCYERSVYKHYMTSDRIKWIDTVLGDHDKILIFLCFTSLNSERVDEKQDSMVEEVLERLLLSKVESPRLCKVLFLYLTDSSVNVQRKHYGDIFHICNPESFSKFVCDVMSFSGRSADDNPDMIGRLLNCKSSKNFLRYTGIKTIPQ